MKHLLLAIAITALVACGGGGGGGSDSNEFIPTDPDKKFPLDKLSSTKPGPVFSFEVTGSDSDGVSYKGSISAANRAMEMYGGVLTTPGDVLLSLKGGGFSVTVTSTGYVDSTGNLVAVVVQTTGVTCIPVSPDSLPDSVKINDFGILSTLVCDDNTTQSQNWRVEDAGSGRINLVTSAAIKNRFNEIISITDLTYTLNGSGKIVSIKMISEILESGFNLTFQS